MRIKPNAVLSLALLIALALSQVSLSGSLASNHGPHPVVREAVRSDTSRPLHEVRPNPPAAGARLELPRKLLPNRMDSPEVEFDDPVWQETPSIEAPTVPLSFEGINNRNGVLPPDTVGDIGPNHYVQAVNLSFAVYSRSGGLLYGPADINTIWNGFGGACQSTNDGDPIVLYDHLADRWMISQFALPNFPFGPFYQCIAVSQTPDPTGAYYRYAFLISNTKMNDYPKFGVWPDAYYMSVNQFNQSTLSWGGQGVVAFERERMLNGLSARMVYFDLFSTDPNLGGMLPADLDGPVPPAGAANPFAVIDDDAWGYSPDRLAIWGFHVDWLNPGNSTFTPVVSLNVAAFNSNLCNYARNCIPQPGGVRVDAIPDRLMYRLQYRNFGDRQVLVTNHTVDVNGKDLAGVRWYELRNTGGGWSVYQQGTFSPDANHRWMGSIAMNGQGDIGLGYSISSTSIYPSVRVTGRLSTDTLGQLPQGEGVIVNGGGVQQHSSGRWGDYSAMSVDPTDDCTFWYTQEYYAVTGSAAWRTRVGSFRLSDCGPVDHPPSAAITNPADGATVSGMVNISADASDDNGVTQVEFFVDGSSIGVDSDGSNGWLASWDTTAVANGAHSVTATATDTIGQPGSDTNNITVNNGGGGATSLHIGDLDGARTPGPGTKRWTATVTITVLDSNGTPVANASVTGNFGDARSTMSCTTNASGTCTVSRGISTGIAIATFSVTNVSHATLPYNPVDNRDPDGDSNGTSITINRP